VAYCLSPDWHLFSASPTGMPFSTRPPDWHICSRAASDRRLSHIYLLQLSRQRGPIPWRW